jgi:hypothetical protein
MDQVPNTLESSLKCDIPTSQSMTSNRKKRRALYRAKRRKTSAIPISAVYDPLSDGHSRKSVESNETMRSSRFTPTMEVIESLISRHPSVLTETAPVQSLISHQTSKDVRKRFQQNPRTRINLSQPRYYEFKA